MANGLLRFADVWLSVWTENKELRKMSNITFNVLEGEFPSSKTNLRIEEFNAINYYYLIVFCSSVAGLILFTSIMICRFFIMCINASKSYTIKCLVEFYAHLQHSPKLTEKE